MSQGDPDWPAWLRRIGPAALLYARQLTDSHQDAEDAVHEGFLRFWLRRAHARDAAGLFFACVRSAALDQRRSTIRRQRRDLASARDVPLFVMEPDSTARHEEIQRALAELPQAQREAVVLKIWGGLTFAQAAQTLDESPNTLAARYRAAMQKLSTLLSPEIRNER